MQKTILMTGATGLIGGYILRALHARGDEVIVLSTHVESARKKLANVKRVIKLDDYLSLKDEKINVIINPAGRNLGEKRWNEEFKKSAYDSRIETTRKMIELISAMKNKPEVLINSSGTDYYADQADKILDENSPPGDTFLAKVCIDWEAEAFKAEEYTRVTAMRTGFVMAPRSEAVERLSMPFKFFIGGPIGSGRQYMPWVHIDDVTGIFLYVIDNANVSGPVNVSAPNPERMKEFSKHLGKAMGKPSIFPVPGFMVKIIAGEMAEVILSGRRAIPKKILEAGYKFKFKHALDAWKDIFAKSD
jgi:uncharacterized protein (TIGR01777 family)